MFQFINIVQRDVIQYLQPKKYKLLVGSSPDPQAKGLAHETRRLQDSIDLICQNRANLV